MSSVGGGVGSAEIRRVFAALPGALILLRADTPHFTIVAATDEYLRLTMTRREAIVGRPVFDVFPEGHERPRARSVPVVRTALERVSRARTPEVLPTQKYLPVLDDNGDVAFIIHGVEDLTERVQPERPSPDQARLRTLESVVTSAHDAVVITEPGPLDEPGPKIVYVNEGFERMSGYRASEVIGRSPRFMQGEMTDRATLRRIREALDRRESVAAELLNYRKDGTPYWVELVVSPVFDEAGELVHFTSVQRDVTARKRSEQDALRLVREQAAREQAEVAHAEMMAILDTIKDGFFAVHSDWRFKYVNARAGELLGRSRDELIGRVLWDEFPGLAQTRFGREYTAAVQEGRSRSFEIYVARIDRWLEVHAHPAANYLSVYLHDATDRRRVEGALRESERRYRALFDTSTDSLLLTAPDGSVAMANTAATELLGYSEQELRELGLDALVNTSDPHVRQLDAESRRSGRFRGELQLRRKDGSQLSVEVSSSVFRDDRGAQWTSMFLRDITRRKAYESDRERLVSQLDSERRWLRAVIDTVPVALVLYVPRGRGGFNRRAEELLGVRVASDGGWVAYESRVLYPDGSPVAHEELPSARSLRTGESVLGAEYLVERADGTRVPILGSAAAIRDNEGKVIGAVGVYQDISERMRAAASIHASERLLTAIFEILPVGLWVTDSHGRITHENAAAERIRCGEYPDAAKPDLWALAAALRGETTVGELKRVSCQGNVQRAIRHSALPLRDEANEFIGAILIDEDVTQLKEAEEALRQAVQTREDVLAIVAHDLRNPLAGILLQTQVLGRAAQDARTRDGIENIRRHASRMNRLIEDLLDVTRIEQGALAIHPGRVRADELLADVLHTQEPIAAKASVDVHLDLRDDVPEVWADRERVVQVLENLIGNALKFTPAGGRVVVGAGPRAHDTLFWVADSGPGIPAADLENIFDRFWQASRKDKRGTGLGLAIVRGIVARHGGRVWAESKPGQGATFFFTMPRADHVGEWPSAPPATR